MNDTFRTLGSRSTVSRNAAGAFHVGRGPVREALKRLTEQGLLVSERNRGVFVPVLSTADVEDIYRLREAVELAALKYLVQNPDPQVFAKLWDILRQYRENLAIQDWDNADENDMAFHRELVHATGSRRLIQAFDTVVVETRMCLRALVFHHPDHPDMESWHADILRAAERGDLPAAQHALEFHNSTVIADIKRGHETGA
ncbi:GntR family transcriptional regulator [Mycolicibacterium rutilum]|uniref:GntR family transcriptional regulator n=1 Tax=Mycolicibacterium rutilum TaxID=370526 RepID=UPI001F1B3568|nr:GntR family transcriptional regulator [Mycolicibacterium rutilum]